MGDELPRIFFDTNEGTHAQGYELSLPHSLAALAALGDRLQAGLEVIIYMPDELEMRAILSFGVEQQVWIARPIEGSIRYLDGSEA
jgi:hypothetical protein